LVGWPICHAIQESAHIQVKACQGSAAVQQADTAAAGAQLHPVDVQHELQQIVAGQLADVVVAVVGFQLQLSQ
jgi:hypothetical protein